MAVLIDTSVLVRTLQQDSELGLAARHALRILAQRQTPLCISPQVLAEYWVVATRPASLNGLGFQPARALDLMNAFRARVRLVFEDENSHEIWARLVGPPDGVRGKRAHDARIAAVALAHGIDVVATFNLHDYERFEGIRALDPRDVVSGADLADDSAQA